jgi:hypothetical protein
MIFQTSYSLPAEETYQTSLDPLLMGPDWSRFRDPTPVQPILGVISTLQLLTPNDDERRTVVDIGQLRRERTCSIEKEKFMASPTMSKSPYIQRLELVRDTITSHTKLGEKAASELAEHVLHVLNSIPEKMR